MLSVTVNNHTYQADLIVFDKDGLMFDSEQFWIEMANARIRAISKYCSKDDLLLWAKIMGVRTMIAEEGRMEATWVDPIGMIGVASPVEEMVILAGLLTSRLGIAWHESRNLATELFAESDKDIDLHRALKPQPGYVSLMKRINDLGIPYGVATSDTLERTRDSMSLYDCWENVRFVVTPTDVSRGKPNPDMLEYISKKNGVPLNRIVMMGDSYVDVKMAKAAGSIGIGVTPFEDMQKKMKSYATEIVDSLEKIEINLCKI